MRKLILIVAAVALVFAGGWYFASPWFAMAGLRDAARDRDREELEERIDFPAVRESVKAQMRAQIADAAERRGVGGAIGAMGSELAGGFTDTVVDTVVNPRGMEAMLLTGSLVPLQDGTDVPEIDWRVERGGLGSFRAIPERDDGGPAPALLFERDGIRWRLVAIEIPGRESE